MRRTPTRALRAAGTAALAGALLLLVAAPSPASAVERLMCGATGTPTAAITHEVLVVLDNQSYPSVIGAGGPSPYQRDVLGRTCGLATQMYGATHTSAANYLALTSGQYPAGSPHACGSVSACDSAVPSLFSQLEGKQGWRSYVESMPRPCDPTSSGSYKNGHNPALFFHGIDCSGRDLGVADLTARSGALWTDLAARTLPGLSVVTPNLLHDGEHGAARADTWLRAFLDTAPTPPPTAAATPP